MYKRRLEQSEESTAGSSALAGERHALVRTEAAMTWWRRAARGKRWLRCEGWQATAFPRDAEVGAPEPVHSLLGLAPESDSSRFTPAL
eukprot:5718204-Pleurochrysis_carterae.AAC.1